MTSDTWNTTTVALDAVWRGSACRRAGPTKIRMIVEGVALSGMRQRSILLRHRRHHALTRCN